MGTNGTWGGTNGTWGNIGGGSGKGGNGTSGGSPSGGLPGIPIGGLDSGKFAVPYAPGGGVPTEIPVGKAFAGRTEGGGSRSQIFGNQYVPTL